MSPYIGYNSESPTKQRHLSPSSHKIWRPDTNIVLLVAEGLSIGKHKIQFKYVSKIQLIKGNVSISSTYIRIVLISHGLFCPWILNPDCLITTYTCVHHSNVPDGSRNNRRTNFFKFFYSHLQQWPLGSIEKQQNYTMLIWPHSKVNADNHVLEHRGSRKQTRYSNFLPWTFFNFLLWCVLNLPYFILQFSCFNSNILEG